MLAPWRAGVTHDRQVTPGVVAEWPSEVIVVYGGPSTGTILRGPFVLPLWSIMGSPILDFLKPHKGLQNCSKHMKHVGSRNYPLSGQTASMYPPRREGSAIAVSYVYYFFQLIGACRTIPW